MLAPENSCWNRNIDSRITLLIGFRLLRKFLCFLLLSSWLPLSSRQGVQLPAEALMKRAAAAPAASGVTNTTKLNTTQNVGRVVEWPIAVEKDMSNEIRFSHNNYHSDLHQTRGSDSAPAGCCLVRLLVRPLEMKQSEQWLFFGDPKAIPFHFTRKKLKTPWPPCTHAPHAFGPKNARHSP